MWKEHKAPNVNENIPIFLKILWLYNFHAFRLLKNIFKNTRTSKSNN